MKSPIGNRSHIITSAFDAQRLNPVTGIVSPHNGADIVPADRKHPCDMFSTIDGTVIDAVGHLPDTHTGNVTIYHRGNYITIKDAAGWTVHLCHCAARSVTLKRGDRVKIGDRVAVMGTTGQSTGIHLHYELRTPAGTPFDPVPYIGTKLLIDGRISVTKEDLKIQDVEVDGKLMRAAYHNLDGTVVISLRGIAELFGYKVDWLPRGGKKIPVIYRNIENSPF